MDTADPPAASAAPTGTERSRRGQVLLAVARQTLEQARASWYDGDRHASPLPQPPDGWEPWLLEPGATFVSLELEGDLRGCIGTLEPYRRLVDDLHANTRNAAFRDPRFPPLASHELVAVRIGVSVVGPLRAMAATTFEAAAAELRPGLDGVLLTVSGERATLLPQVWRDLPEPLDFVAALARKAGLGSAQRDGGARLLRFQRYEVESWQE
jgi:AmmeMemoRadiSam system protein A